MEMTGTSVSAPQVTWIAGLLRSILADVPGSAIKARILAGADVRPELVTSIAEGRVHNPVKALSLMQDVLELRRVSASDKQSGDSSNRSTETSARKIIRGVVKNGRDLQEYCADETVLTTKKLIRLSLILTA